MTSPSLDFIVMVNDVAATAEIVSPLSMSVSKRSRIPTSALRTLARVRLSRSTFIVSRARGASSPESSPARCRHGVTAPQRLAVDLVNAIPLVILDPGIIADRNELLLHLKEPTARNIVALSKESHSRPSLLLYAATVPRPVRQDIARHE
jgi:hypothetical protein